MSTNEQFYDEQIAPALLALAERCKERGMSLVATVEYEPKARASTFSLTEEACLAMRMLAMCANAGENVDAYMIGLTRYCRENGVDTSSSIYLRRAGDPR